MTALVRPPLACELCGRPLTSFCLRCFSCGALTEVGKQNERQPTPDELADALEELDREGDDCDEPDVDVVTKASWYR